MSRAHVLRAVLRPRRLPARSLRSGGRALRATCPTAFEAKGTWRERIRGALSLLLEQLDAEPDVARLCIVEAPRAGRELLERRRQVLETLAVAVDEGRAQTRSGAGPPPLTAQGVVGGVLSVIHTRLIEAQRPPVPAPSRTMGVPSGRRGAGALVDLTNPLMAMIVHPYLGPAAARKELERPAPTSPRHSPATEPTRSRVCRSASPIAPRAYSTRSLPSRAPPTAISQIRSGIADEGQMSRLLRRLESCELIENQGEGHIKGEPNAWALTERGGRYMRRSRSKNRWLSGACKRDASGGYAVGAARTRKGVEDRLRQALASGPDLDGDYLLSYLVVVDEAPLDLLAYDALGMTGRQPGDIGVCVVIGVHGHGSG